MGLKSLLLTAATALGFRRDPAPQKKLVKSSYRPPAMAGAAAVFGAQTGVSFGVGLVQSGSAKAWGMSAECRKMRRKNKLRSLGLGGQRC